MSSSSEPSKTAPKKRLRRFPIRWRRRGKRLKPFELKKALFILPNAFTLASVLCGLYAILLANTQSGYDNLFQASLAIMAAGFFDSFDGRLARLTKTQSAFGVQMDSLADVISFGVAPAILVYRWALWPLGHWGTAVAFVFVACGTIRLARFNVMADRGEESNKFFTGLPIPAAAGTVVMMVIAHYKAIGTLPVVHRNMVIFVVLSLAALMVSNVPYWAFKDLKPKPKPIFFILTALMLIVLISLLTRASVAFLAFALCYIVSGFALWVGKKLFAPPSQETA